MRRWPPACLRHARSPAPSEMLKAGSAIAQDKGSSFNLAPFTASLDRNIGLEGCIVDISHFFDNFIA